MNYEAYRNAFFSNPQPEPRFFFRGFHGYAISVHDFDRALEFYSRVLGPPAYAEGERTRGWRIGDAWLTLFGVDSAEAGSSEITIETATPDEADRLQRELIAAGGEGEAPTDQLMYEPIRYCPCTDPFGNRLLIIARRDRG